MKWLFKMFGWGTCSSCNGFQFLPHKLETPAGAKLCSDCWEHWGDGGKSVRYEAADKQPVVKAPIKLAARPRIALKPPD